MKATINEREYELKELTKEEARAYIGKEVYVWDDLNGVTKNKLLEVFMPECDYPFCVLSSTNTAVCNYKYCAPVPVEYFVFYNEEYEPPKKYFVTTDGNTSNPIVDFGSKEYCKQKAKELNALKESAEHPLTNYELTQLLKCFGVDYTHKCNYDSAFNAVHQTYTYPKGEDKENCRGDIVIRYKCGEWMPATRETVWKWVEENKTDMFDEVKYFVRFMGWFEDKE